MIKLTTLTLFATLLLTSGCQHTFDGSGRSLVSLRLHDATPAQEQIIARSAHIWDAVGARFRWEGEEAGGEILNLYFIHKEIIPHSGSDAAPEITKVYIPCGQIDTAIGCFNPNTGNITLSGTMDEYLFYGAAHEIGHSMGLHHINDDKNALMFPYVGMNGLDENDIVQYDLRWSRYADSGHPDDKPTLDSTEEVE